MNAPRLSPEVEQQLCELLAELESTHPGDFSRRFPVQGSHPLLDRIAKAFNLRAQHTEGLVQALADKDKDIATISRAALTGLNNMRVVAGLFMENRGGHLSPMEVEYAKVLHASIHDLHEFFTEVITAPSQTEAGMLKVEASDVSLTDVRQHLEGPFKSVAKQKGVEFSVSWEKEVPLGLYTDPRMLELVLKNLLSNAFKFTKRGRVELRVSYGGSQPSRFSSPSLLNAGRVLAFSVVDTGMGIPLDEQKAIFEPLTRVYGAAGYRSVGRGVGLAISRELAHQLGGELHVESQPGQGSTFTLYLPEQHGRPEAQASSPAPSTGVSTLRGEERQSPWQRPPEPTTARASLGGRKVLVVDDDVRNIFALSCVLENQGMKVVFAETGKEALKVLRSTPDVEAVLLDVVMPEMDGYEVMSAIRQEPRYDLLPVIAITAHAPKDGREKFLAAGANDFVPKPVELDLLFETLRRWLPQPAESQLRAEGE